jgi:hypothetical protein
MPAFRAQYGGDPALRRIRYAADLAELAAAADPLVILTAWPEFRERKALFAGRTVLDFRYTSDPA